MRWVFALVAIGLALGCARGVKAQAAGAADAGAAAEADVGAVGDAGTHAEPDAGAPADAGAGPEDDTQVGVDSDSEIEEASQSAEESPPVLEQSVPPPEPLLENAEGLPAEAASIVYVVERIDIVGNTTSDKVIRSFLTIEPGDLLDVDDPGIERLRFRLLGTGWFEDVRLRLARGSERGRVVLVIEVKERNTIVVSRVIAGLSRVVTSSEDRNDALRPYAGLGITETNLFGLGIGLGVAGVVSEQQQGVDLRYHDPVRLGARFDLRGRFFYNNAREFFGRSPLVSIGRDCPDPDNLPEGAEPCDPDVQSKRAVVIYERAGFGFGTGRDLSAHMRYELGWLGELVDVGNKPQAASTLRGENDEERAPIDFYIDDETSHVSSLQLALIFDTRDDPALPARGQLLRFDAQLGSGLLGSSYDFARLEATFRQYVRLPWGHVLSPGVYVGSVFGDAPFFYRFYAADVSDLLPSRQLELNLDHRRTHNLLGTAIQDSDKEDFVARLDVEYQLPLHRGSGTVRGVDAYAGAGLFMLADRDALDIGLPGYEGLERVPVDFTFDIGVQADTAYGLFKVGFSTLIGFLPDLGQAQ